MCFFDETTFFTYNDKLLSVSKKNTSSLNYTLIKMFYECLNPTSFSFFKSINRFNRFSLLLNRKRWNLIKFLLIVATFLILCQVWVSLTLRLTTFFGVDLKGVAHIGHTTLFRTQILTNIRTIFICVLKNLENVKSVRFRKIPFIIIFGFVYLYTDRL